MFASSETCPTWTSRHHHLTTFSNLSLPLIEPLKSPVQIIAHPRLSSHQGAQPRIPFSMASPEPHIVELAKRIAANTEKLQSYLSSHKLPTPSFDVDGPKDTLIPKTETETEAARVAIVDDTEELRRLVLGPREYLMSYTVSLSYFPALLPPISL